MIKRGQIVKYATKWRREEEKNEFMLVLDAFNDVDRIYVKSLTTKLVLGSTECVASEMIVPTGVDVEGLMDFSDMVRDKNRRKELKAIIKEALKCKSDKEINKSVGLVRFKGKAEDRLYVVFLPEGHAAKSFEVSARKLDDIIAEADSYAKEFFTTIIQDTVEKYTE